MKTPFALCSKPARFLGVALSLAMGLSSFGALMVPATSAAATGSPEVAQQPLALQPPIPPDIVLMLDDSGSMNANFMPDWKYLATSNDALIDAANNGVYYNPDPPPDPVTHKKEPYLPPPHADGTTYPSQTDMSNVRVDGFGAMTTKTVNLFTYAGEWECDDASHCGNGTIPNSYSKIDFNTSVLSTTASTYSAMAASADDCQAKWNSTPNAIGTITFNNGNSTDGSGNCTFQYYDVNHYFQYSTGPAAGPYTVHYVAPAAQGCGSQPNCVTDDTPADGANGAPAGVDSAGNPLTVGENIANWFAYYHTRLLMAKSGVMAAFADLDPNSRVGFGSINGRNAALISTFPNPYKFSTSTQSNNYLAGVAPFGKSSDPSTTAGISRFNFWNWIASETADKTTPLRQALDAVGQYYSHNDSTTPASNAWDWMASDPGYSTRGTASNIACRRAYTILTTDGFWNGNAPSGIAAGTTDTNGPVFKSTDSNGNTINLGYKAVPPFSGGDADSGPSLADVATYYWANDLQTGLSDEVPKNSVDPAVWQHMVTFTLGLGFNPKYADQTTPIPMDQVEAWAQGGTPISGWDTNGWPPPSAANNGSINNIADLAHAGINGHGGFSSAKSPDDLKNALIAALSAATSEVHTGASLSANSTALQVGTVIFQAKYFPTKTKVNGFTPKWEGDLEAWQLNPVTGAVVRDKVDPVTHEVTPLPPLWSASGNLPASADRDIQTYNPDTGAFTAFKNGSGTPPDLSTAQLAALGSDAAAQEAMVDYLRGDATNEKQNSGAFRDRTTPLGDIVDSQPVYSGPPDPNEFINQTFFGTTVDSSTKRVPFYDWAVGITDTSGTFTASAASKRMPLVFVAANDGMLHAFNAPDPVCTTNPDTNEVTCTSPADAGKEVYAYLPGAVITAGLKDLSDLAYGTDADPHQFYNDGQLTIADAYVKLPGDTSPQWHTILVGTTGRGTARAVYALDVTDPDNITPLWERSAGDGKSGSGYIGQMVGKPVIAQTNYLPASGGTSASSTWSVLIGNGYNSTVGASALLQFNLATGALNVHTTTDTTGGNGLAAPVVWMDNPANGVSTVAYAGDLHGQVWSFKLNDTSGSNPTPASTGSLLFTAKDAGGKAQPITAGMLAGKDAHSGNVWVFFGTGQYLSSTDLANHDAQTWYGLIVQSSTSKLVSNLANGRSALVQREITAQTAASGSSLAARAVTALANPNTDGTTDMTGKSGWYLDLLAPIGTSGAPVAQGERMVDPNQFQGSLLIGVTRIPVVTDVCNPSGSGWIMALDPFTGTAPGDDFFDVNGDNYINAGDRIGGDHAAGVGFGSLPNAPIFVGGIMETSLFDATTASLKTAGTIGTMQRVTWRELVNP